MLTVKLEVVAGLWPSIRFSSVFLQRLPAFDMCENLAAHHECCTKHKLCLEVCAFENEQQHKQPDGSYLEHGRFRHCLPCYGLRLAALTIRSFAGDIRIH